MRDRTKGRKERKKEREEERPVIFRMFRVDLRRFGDVNRFATNPALSVFNTRQNFT
jgi:hypothetical protein